MSQHTKMAAKCVKHVVVDSGGFILNSPISEIGEKIYTIPEVVNEVRSKEIRQRLQVLPYEIIFRQPSPEAIKFDFSKKTGDYRSLSAVDLRVLALCYMLEKENIGTEHIRTEPLRKVEWTTTTKQLEKPTDIAGFYVGKKNSSNSSRTVSESQSIEDSEIIKKVESTDIDPAKTEEKLQVSTVTPTETDHSSGDGVNSSVSHSHPAALEETGTVNDSNNQSLSNDDQIEKNSVEKCGQNPAQVADGECLPTDLLGEEGSSEDEEEDEDDDDDEGWITPGNIKQIREQMGGPDIERAEVEVGCITTDFAMQNVLIQMGLNVISVEGMLIKRAKSYVLRCSACMKITTNMVKEFCPNCGNKTLQKVSMSVEEDGSIKYHLSRRKQFNTRGLKYSLPAPKGGKHADNPILVADQKEAQQRTSGASRKKFDVFDPDYTANTSPFALNDVTSRAAQLGIRDHRRNFQKRRNPNENKKVYGRRK